MGFGGCVVILFLSTLLGIELTRADDAISDVIQVRGIAYNYTLYAAYNLVNLEKLKDLATKIIQLSKKDDELFNE